MVAPTEYLDNAVQPARLAALLPRWLELPVYRTRLGGNHRPENLDFFRLPFITKRDMRTDFPRNFLPGEGTLETLLEQKRVELEHTSGTSEERTPVLLEHGWWARQEARALRLNPLAAQMLQEHSLPRRVWLTTPVCNGTACHSRWSPRSARTDGAALSVNQSRIPFVLTGEELQRMAEETADWAPQFMDLDPVHGAWFALYCERHGIRFPSLKFVLCSYEYTSVVHRRILERALGVPVLNLYGATETGHLLMEDAHGRMRPSLDTAFLEVVQPDETGVGDLVVTTLSNDYMPLLRYRIGDLVSRTSTADGDVYVVHGRARDALQTPQGRRVTTAQVDRCFAGINGLAHYQLRQTETGSCELRYVPDAAGPTAAALNEVTARLQEVLEISAPIPTESCDVLAPAPSGKFRLTCRV